LQKPIGRLRVGDSADLVLVDPAAEWVVQKDSFASKSKNSPFIGSKLKGQVVMTLVGGRKVYSRG
jgi:dihydroorotase